jgi:hypothetical protein
MSRDSASRRSDSGFAALNFQLDDLPIDVFEVDGGGLTIESLTGGHGMTEMGASCRCSCCGNELCQCGASGSCVQQ